jgi:hypothetical protein
MPAQKRREWHPASKDREMIANYHPLIHGLIGAFLFLESGGPNEVNPDSAVRCMENIASELLTMDQADQFALRSDLERIAGAAQDSAYASFVQALPNMIGLASPK